MKLSTTYPRLIEENTALAEQPELKILSLRRVRPIKNRISRVNSGEARCQQSCDTANVSRASADFRAAGADAGGQSLRESPAVAKGNGLAIQWAGILSPYGEAAGIGHATVTGTERAAMRSVATRAAAGYEAQREMVGVV